MSRNAKLRRPMCGKGMRLAAATAMWMTLAGTDQVIWYAYCEGSAGGRGVAIISENSWSHPNTTEYGRDVGRSAEEYFERKYRLPLAGCAGVPSRHPALAEHSRDRTVRLHTDMGDEVHLYHLPGSIVPERTVPSNEGQSATSSVASETSQDPEEPRTEATGRWLRSGVRD